MRPVGRHQCPLERDEAGPDHLVERRQHLLDPFLAVERTTPVIVHYPGELDPPLAALLTQLAASVAYLGRAESWVDARVLDSTPDTESRAWCRPTESVDGDCQGIRLLAPMSPASYSEWRATFEHAATKAAAKRIHKRPSVPPDLIECLLADTGRLQKEGWTDPPGTRWVLYSRPAETLRRPALRRRPLLGHTQTVEAVLLTLSPVAASGGDGRRGVRPLMGRAVPQAELLHQSAIAALGPDAPQCAVLTGRTAQGERLQGHGHAHYLPLDLDGDNRIDHVLVYAPGGLDGRAQSALSRVHRTWTKRQVGDLTVRVVGRGSVAQIREQLDNDRKPRLGIIGNGDVWVSATPFVPPRHLKRSRHTLRDQVRDELASRGFPVPTTIELLPPLELVQRRLFSFVTTRRGGKPQPPARISFGIRITFPEPVSGPIAIGYGSHFGLGLFEPKETEQ